MLRDHLEEPITIRTQFGAIFVSLELSRKTWLITSPTPWRSGSIENEQGMSKAGNPLLRTTMLEIASLWLRRQPHSALARWFHALLGEHPTKARKKTMIVALARKLLIALWKYVRFGEMIEGAIMTPSV